MNWGQIILFVISNWDKVFKPILALLNLPTNLEELKEIFLDGDSDMKNLYYEVVNVTVATEIKKAYEEAIANNKKYYRCKTSSGKIVGWNTKDAKFISLEKAQELYPDTLYANGDDFWFINPKYNDEPQIGLEQPKEPLGVVTPAKPKKVNIASIESIKKNAEESAAAFADIMAKYDDICAELETANNTIKEQQQTIELLKASLSEQTEKAECIVAGEETAQKELNDLRAAVAKFIDFIRSNAKNGKQGK